MKFNAKYNLNLKQKVKEIKFGMEKSCLFTAAALILLGGSFGMLAINREVEALYKKAGSFEKQSGKLEANADGAKAMALTADIGAVLFLGLGLISGSKKRKSR